ncbi:arginine biosynthesis bifunctional protein ArgJ [Helicobacter mustelae]|nr:arginine biosynthesis bifunctional protein ArgJ [Helicobacter mustelae]
MSREKKAKKIISGVYDLSLGISIVVAILLGVGVGYLLAKYSGITWLFWLGVSWGIGAALLNVQKAYKRTKKALEEMAKDKRYTYTRGNLEHSQDASNPTQGSETPAQEISQNSGQENSKNSAQHLKSPQSSL